MSRCRTTCEPTSPSTMQRGFCIYELINDRPQPAKTGRTSTRLEEAMTMRMCRRTFALSAACAIMTARSASAQTAELKVSHFLPPNHTLQKAMVAWSDEIEKQTAGRLKLRIYPAGLHGGGPNRQFAAARNGVVDIAISLHGATPGRYAMTELASLPFAAPSTGNRSVTTSRRLTELAPTYLTKEH